MCVKIASRSTQATFEFYRLICKAIVRLQEWPRHYSFTQCRQVHCAVYCTDHTTQSMLHACKSGNRLTPTSISSDDCGCCSQWEPARDMQEAALHLAFVVFIVCLAQTAMIESHNICVHMCVYTWCVYLKHRHM